MSAEPRNEEFQKLGKDHRELSKAVQDLAVNLSTAIEKVDGKVDKAVALLERASERQDRHEDLVVRLQSEISQLRERNDARIRELEEKTDEKVNKIREEQRGTARIVTLAIGGIAVLSFLFPHILKLILPIPIP